MEQQAVIIEAVRTPFGRRGSALREIRPDMLLAKTINEVIRRAGVPAEKIEDVLAGCVSQAGEQGGNIARQAALLAGFPNTVPGASVNRMCGSSQYTTHAAEIEINPETIAQLLYTSGTTAAPKGASTTEKELTQHVHNHLAAFKVPKKIYFVDDMPRNASGKLLKRQLRARYSSQT